MSEGAEEYYRKDFYITAVTSTPMYEYKYYLVYQVPGIRIVGGMINHPYVRTNTKNRSQRWYHIAPQPANKPTCVSVDRCVQEWHEPAGLKHLLLAKPLVLSLIHI